MGAQLPLQLLRWHDFNTTNPQFTGRLGTSASFPNITQGTNKAYAYSLGLKWLPNYYARFMLNLIHTEFDTPVTVNGQEHRLRERHHAARTSGLLIRRGSSMTSLNSIRHGREKRASGAVARFGYRYALALAFSQVATVPAQAADLMVAAASSLTNAFTEIGRAYEKARPGTPRVVQLRRLGAASSADFARCAGRRVRFCGHRDHGPSGEAEPDLGFLAREFRCQQAPAWYCPVTPS